MSERNFIQICSNLAKSTGGPYASSLSLHFAAFESNENSRLIASTNESIANFENYSAYSNLNIFASKRNLLYSLPIAELREIWKTLRNDKNWVHIHGLFTFTSAITGIFALILDKNIGLQTHGIFDQYDQARGRIKKKIVSNTLLYPLRLKTVLVLTSSESEANMIPKNYFPNSEILTSKYGLPDNRLYQIHSESAFELVKTLERTNGPKILYFSRVTRKKNLPFLAKVIEVLSKEIPNLNLVVVGPTDEQGDEDLEISRNILGTRLHYLGPVYSSELKARIFAMSNLFALPSQSENFSLATFEALEHGLPCVISPHVGVAEWYSLNHLQISVLDISIEKWCYQFRLILQNPIKFERDSQTVRLNNGWEKIYHEIMRQVALLS